MYDSSQGAPAPAAVRAVVTELAETPPEAIERIALEPMPPIDVASLSPRDVIVHVKSASVGWVDLIMTSGQYQHLPKPPYTPGLEYAGAIAWLGPEANAPGQPELTLGQEVLVDPFLAGPRTLGDYELVREIGRGGMGRVYLAEEVREAFTRQLALKVIDRPWGASDRERRFRSEVRILASLEHPGIARFLEGGELPGGTLFLALEYVDGQDILTFANQRGLATDERVRLVVEVLGAVAYAHQQGVVHRDLKPPNILVDRFGRTRLLDFGVAKLLEEDGASAHPLTEPELRVFTPAYASPEQFSGKPVSVASDIYSAAVLLYELLTGSRPFGGAGSSRAQLERDVLSSEPSPPRRRLPHAPSPSRRARCRRSPSSSRASIANRRMSQPGRRSPSPWCASSARKRRR